MMDCGENSQNGRGDGGDVVIGVDGRGGMMMIGDTAVVVAGML